MRGQFVISAIERNRAGDEAEGLADATVAAYVNIDRVEGRVDDVDLALVHLCRLAEEVFYVAFIPGRIRIRVAISFEDAQGRSR